MRTLKIEKAEAFLLRRVLKPGEAGIALIGRPVTKEEFLFRLKDPLFECFIAFLGEKPAGSVFCELKDEKKGKKKHGWIYGLGVLSSYQRLKIGTTLLNRSLRFLK